MINIQNIKDISGDYLDKQNIKKYGLLSPQLLSTKIENKVKKLIVITRHGQRFPIKKINYIPEDIISDNNDPKLTKMGMEYCQQFGYFLRDVYEKYFDFKLDSSLFI